MEGEKRWWEREGEKRREGDAGASYVLCELEDYDSQSSRPAIVLIAYEPAVAVADV